MENSYVLNLLDNKIKDIEHIIDTYNQGKVIKDGINVAILGRPNVGKSSLLNVLANYDRAIVTDVAGTTRDIVEETINIGNVILNIFDTAGIRKTDDVVEKIGVDKSINILSKVDLCLYVFDCTSKIDEDDKIILSKIQNKGLKFIPVINKIDKTEKLIFDAFMSELKILGIDNPIQISVLEKKGIDSLKNRIEEMFLNNDLDYEHELIITDERHRMLLDESIEYLKEAKKEIEQKQEIDIISIFVKKSSDVLGQIIGANVNEDIISKIFEKFCVGK